MTKTNLYQNLVPDLIEKKFQVIRKEHKTFPQGVDPTGYQSDHFIQKLF